MFVVSTQGHHMNTALFQIGVFPQGVNSSEPRFEHLQILRYRIHAADGPLDLVFVVFPRVQIPEGVLG